MTPFNNINTEILLRVYRDGREAGMLEVVREYNPRADLISRREAERMFSKGWVSAVLKRGIITPVRQGEFKNSKIRYSRLAWQELWNAYQTNTYIQTIKPNDNEKD